MTDHRLDMYSELAEALGCDAMDSHPGRVEQAAHAKAAKEALRRVQAALVSAEPWEERGRLALAIATEALTRPWK